VDLLQLSNGFDLDHDPVVDDQIQLLAM